MFCQKCGKETTGDAKFCPSCGIEVSTQTTISSSKELKLILKPMIKLPVIIARFIPIQLFLMIFIGIFALNISQHLKYFDINTVILLVVIVPFIVPIAGYYITKMTYKKTEYRFYATKFDYTEGFFQVEEKAIDYKNVTEVSLRKGIIQKMFNLGTIVLSTPATAVYQGTSASGIQIKDIENPDEIYKITKKFIRI